MEPRFILFSEAAITMGHSLDVQVLDSDGDPVPHKHVHMLIDGFWKGGGLDAYTDDDGHASFETADDYEDSRELWIAVADQHFGPFEIEGGAYTVTLD